MSGREPMLEGPRFFWHVAVPCMEEDLAQPFVLTSPFFGEFEKPGGVVLVIGPNKLLKVARKHAPVACKGIGEHGGSLHGRKLPEVACKDHIDPSPAEQKLEALRRMWPIRHLTSSTSSWPACDLATAFLAALVHDEPAKMLPTTKQLDVLRAVFVCVRFLITISAK